MNSVIVPGGFGSRGMEGKIRACQWCRENKKPFLGICLGMQAAVIEFARNVIGLEVFYLKIPTYSVESVYLSRIHFLLQNANTTEIDPASKHPMIIDMPEFHPGDMGGTMRLGKRKTVFKDNCNSVISKYSVCVA